MAISYRQASMITGVVFLPAVVPGNGYGDAQPTRDLVNPSTSFVRGQSQAPVKSAPELDADDSLPTPAELATLNVPKIGLIGTYSAGFQPYSDGSQITFTYRTDVANVSLRQIAEIIRSAVDSAVEYG
jgi:hypothetical protein